MSKPNELPSKPQCRLVTALMDSIPKAFTGRIKRHEFTTTLGAGVVFEKGNVMLGKATFSMAPLHPAHVWTAQELRELAAECEEMAKYLDRISN